MFEVQFVAQGAQAGGRDLIDGKQNDIALLLKRTGQLVKSPRFSGAREAKDEQVTTGHASFELVRHRPLNGDAMSANFNP